MVTRPATGALFTVHSRSHPPLKQHHHHHRDPPQPARSLPPVKIMRGCLAHVAPCEHCCYLPSWSVIGIVSPSYLCQVGVGWDCVLWSVEVVSRKSINECSCRNINREKFAEMFGELFVLIIIVIKSQRRCCAR